MAVRRSSSKSGTPYDKKAGQESFKSITRAYYRAAAVGILVYDITCRESFEAINTWLEECKVNGNPEMTLVLVGNKSDLPSQREVSFADGEQFAQRNGMIFLEASAKTDSRVGEIFIKSAKKVNEKITKNIIDPKNEMYGVKLGTLFNGGESSLLRSAPKRDQRKSCCE
jgi:Ras-related protein Rab-2A